MLTKSDVLAGRRARGRDRDERTGRSRVRALSSQIPKETQRGRTPSPQALAERRTLIVGQSGVGKSSLFGALGGESLVGDVSKIGRGKQTTTTGPSLPFCPRGFMIDSPGVGEFELVGLYGPQQNSPPDSGKWSKYAGGTCRFGDCTHRSEPGLFKVRDGRRFGRVHRRVPVRELFAR